MPPLKSYALSLHDALPISEATWWACQDRLDDPDLVTNRMGTDRRHLGSGLYLCGWKDVETGEVGGKPVRAHGLRYRCEGHVLRLREHIDTYVVETIRARLARPDLRNVIATPDNPRLRAISDEIMMHRRSEERRVGKEGRSRSWTEVRERVRETQ